MTVGQGNSQFGVLMLWATLTAILSLEHTTEQISKISKELISLQLKISM